MTTKVLLAGMTDAAPIVPATAQDMTTNMSDPTTQTSPTPTPPGMPMGSPDSAGTHGAMPTPTATASGACGRATTPPMSPPAGATPPW